MINLANSRPLADFHRNARHVLEGLNETREPLLLTVNGQVQAVVMDPETFQHFEDFLEQEKFIAALKEGLQDLDEGYTHSLQETKEEMKVRYGF